MCAEQRDGVQLLIDEGEEEICVLVHDRARRKRRRQRDEREVSQKRVRWRESLEEHEECEQANGSAEASAEATELSSHGKSQCVQVQEVAIESPKSQNSGMTQSASE